MPLNGQKPYGQEAFSTLWIVGPTIGGRIFYTRMTRRTVLRRIQAIVQVTVRDNNVEQALRVLKKKMQGEGLFREMKMRRSYEKPSVKRARSKADAVRRRRKFLRKRMEREGY